MKHLVKAMRLLTPPERRQAWLILFLITVMAVFNMISTVSVMPFLAVMANPEMIQHSRILSFIYDELGFTSNQSFLFFLGITSFVMLVLAAVVRTGGQYYVNSFTQLRSYSIGKRLFETYLRRPYAYYMTHHTGDMSKSLLNEINVLVSEVYQPLSALVAQGLLFIVLVVMLVVVNPEVAVIGMGVISLCYGSIFLLVRRSLDRMGLQRAGADRERFRVLAEALGGIKALKLLGRERHYLDQFDGAAKRLARVQAITQTLGIVPRYGIEAVAFGGIILMTLILMVRYADRPNGALSEVLPLIGLYAFAGYRILPALQSIYQALTQLRFGGAALDIILDDLVDRDSLPQLATTPPRPLPFERTIELKAVSFCHEGAATPSLSNVNLSIPKGSTLGIVGSTGAGKTTLVDLFLGLLAPTSGGITVDDLPVSPDNMHAWQADLGYVPQDIFLLDSSIAQNIAFGTRAGEIDRDRVRECARMAQILEFVESQLPQGLDTMVGERGVRLSGGQRQRIGIARALYRDPGVLVFDEATSALDNLTEHEVVRAINALTGTRTILIVAHRISTVQNCDQILVLERGRVVGLGRYEELYAANPAFRRLVDARTAA